MPEVVIVADFEALFKRLLGRQRETGTNLRMVGIRAGYISNRSQVCSEVGIL
jgi:hypothetical protein